MPIKSREIFFLTEFVICVFFFDAFFVKSTYLYFDKKIMLVIMSFDCKYCNAKNIKFFSGHTKKSIDSTLNCGIYHIRTCILEQINNKITVIE